MIITWFIFSLLLIIIFLLEKCVLEVKGGTIEHHQCRHLHLEGFQYDGIQSL